jgi:hypothetical protein
MPKNSERKTSKIMATLSVVLAGLALGTALIAVALQRSSAGDESRRIVAVMRVQALEKKQIARLGGELGKIGHTVGAFRRPGSAAGAAGSGIVLLSVRGAQLGVRTVQANVRDAEGSSCRRGASPAVAGYAHARAAGSGSRTQCRASSAHSRRYRQRK